MIKVLSTEICDEIDDSYFLRFIFQNDLNQSVGKLKSHQADIYYRADEVRKSYQSRRAVVWFKEYSKRSPLIWPKIVRNESKTISLTSYQYTCYYYVW